MERDKKWLQLRVALGPRAMGAGGVLDRVLFLVNDLIAEASIENFSFARETSGLRLHLASTSQNDKSVQERILALMQELSEEQLISHTRLGYADPETARFRESGLMLALDELWQADSIGWWKGERLRRTGEARISVPLLSLAILNDLFFAVLGVGEEVWDVWCNVAWSDLPPHERFGLLHRGVRSEPPAVVTLDSLARHVAGQERELVSEYEKTNKTFARRLQALFESGRPLKRRTHILPLFAQSHFNRHDLSALERRQVYEVMINMLEPGRGFVSTGNRTSA